MNEYKGIKYNITMQGRGDFTIVLDSKMNDHTGKYSQLNFSKKEGEKAVIEDIIKFVINHVKND